MSLQFILDYVAEKGLEKKVFFFVVVLFFCSVIFVVIRLFWGKELLKVGVMMPVYGEKSFVTDSMMRGMKMALKQTKMEIDFIVEDVSCNPKEAEDSFQRFVDEDIRIIVGPVCWENLTVVAGLSDEEQALVITPAVTKKEVEDAGEYVFRTVPSIYQFSRELVQIIYEKGHSRLAILHPAAGEYQNIAQQLSGKYQNLGGKVVFQQSYNQRFHRIDNIALRLKNQTFDAILLFVNDFETTEMVLKRLSVDVSPSLIFIVDDALGRHVLPTKFANGTKIILPSAGNADFLEHFYDLYLEETLDFYTVSGYNAAIALTSALRLGHHSAREIRNFFYKEEFHGSNGIFSFDKFGDIVTPLQVYEVREGELCLVVYDDLGFRRNSCIRPFVDKKSL